MCEEGERYAGIKGVGLREEGGSAQRPNDDLNHLRRLNRVLFFSPFKLLFALRSVTHPPFFRWYLLNVCNNNKNRLLLVVVVRCYRSCFAMCVCECVYIRVHCACHTDVQVCSTCVSVSVYRRARVV
jgi:hypothetical protein